MASKNWLTLAALVAAPVLLGIGVKTTSDKQQRKALEIAVRGGNSNVTGPIPNANPSALDVRLVPLQTTIKPSTKRRPDGTRLTNLVWPISIENHSTQTIRADIEHEWHGGLWPPTDLFVYQTGARGIAPVYLVGESGSRTKATVVAPGQSARLDLKMNWAGTGSVQGGTIMDDDRAGVYRLRVVLLLGQGKRKSYVASPLTEVRVEVE